jgi:hypothetical protein
MLGWSCGRCGCPREQEANVMDFTQACDQVAQLVRAGIPREDITARQPCPAFSTSWEVSARLSGPLRLTGNTRLRLHPGLTFTQAAPEASARLPRSSSARA